jgi:hypothetical protein
MLIADVRGRQWPTPDTGIVLGDLLIVAGLTADVERIVWRSKARACAGGRGPG